MNDLFNYKVDLSPMVMDIRSETLEPISTSTYRYVFRLDQAGELDANSLLLFKPKLSAVGHAASAVGHRVNPWGGGLLAIKRATFQVGDYILNDTQDVGRISNLLDMSSVNSNNMSKYNSHYFLNNWHCKVLDTGGSAAGANTETKDGGEGTIIYDRKRSGMDFGLPNNAGAGAKVNSCVISNNVDNNHQIGIPLGNLFPCIKNQQIPLYLFQDYRILITVEFETSEKWVNRIESAAAYTATADAVTPAEVKLQVDYIIYPSEIQNKLRNQTNAQGGLNLSFPDIIKVEKQIPATGGVSGAEQRVELRLGMDNKEIHKIYMLKQLDRGAPAEQDRIFLNARCDGMNQESYNVNIDGSDIYQDHKESPASQYDETSYCLGADLQVPRPCFFNDENTILSRLADSAGGLLGKMKPLCLDLSNGNPGVVGAGREIGAYPIIWKYKRKPTDAIPNNYGGSNAGGADQGAGNMCEDLRGALSVDFFVIASRTANITSTPSGTSVMVSY